MESKIAQHHLNKHSSRLMKLMSGHSNIAPVRAVFRNSPSVVTDEQTFRTRKPWRAAQFQNMPLPVRVAPNPFKASYGSCQWLISYTTTSTTDVFPTRRRRFRSRPFPNDAIPSHRMQTKSNSQESYTVVVRFRSQSVANDPSRFSGVLLQSASPSKSQSIRENRSGSGMTATKLGINLQIKQFRN